MKVLVVASAIDMRLPYGCTGAWWHLLKALHLEGVELVVTPYRGRPVESPWWRACDNPRLRMGSVYDALRKHSGAYRRRSRGTRKMPRQNVELSLIRRLVTPRWKVHLRRTLEMEGDVDAVLILTVPMSHLRGIPTMIRQEFSIPVWFFDGDLPESLPAYGGFGSGFNMYHGADPGEYDALISNSQGALETLRTMGARRAEVLWWGADPDVHRPVDIPEDIDVFFYGLGAEHRVDWLRDMIAIPSLRLPNRRFVVAGWRLETDFGAAERLDWISPTQLGAMVARSRVCLNVSREAHASVYASATTRLFELAAMARPIVTNPVAGLSEWFEPGREIEVVNTSGEAVAAYERLFRDEAGRRALGQAARQRVVNQHTYTHRAKQLHGYLAGIPLGSQ